MPINREQIFRVCIDDFALKKRKSYGTVMVNIDTHEVVDMLHSRDEQSVSAWLRSFPNIEVISRDGSITYAKATPDAHPNAIQVTDRFHLLKNLCEYAKACITKMLPQIVYVSDNYEKNEPKFLSNTKSVKNHIACVNRKQATVDMVRKLKTDGLSIHSISKETGFCRNTIKKYLDPSFQIEHASYGNWRTSNLYEYHDEIVDSIGQNMAGTEIFRNLKAKGYSGSASNLRTYISRFKQNIGRLASQIKPKYVRKQQLIRLIYHPLETVKNLEPNDYFTVTKKYPNVKELLELVWEFRILLKDRNFAGLIRWIEAIKQTSFTELHSFTNGLYT